MRPGTLRNNSAARGVVRDGRLSEIQLRIEAMLASGKRQFQIAAELQMNPHSVSRHVERIRNVRALEKARTTPSIDPGKRDRTVLRLAQEGLTYDTIAQRLGMSRSNVGRILSGEKP